MRNGTQVIKDVTQKFFMEHRLSIAEHSYLQELVPFEVQKPLTLDEYIELFNEVASFYTGELANLIKKYLLLNDLFCKDNARIIKEGLMLFRRFFHYLLQEIKTMQLQESTLNRLQYVVLKVDKYLKKFSPHLGI